MKYDAKDTGPPNFGDFTAYLLGKGDRYVFAQTFK